MGRADIERVVGGTSYRATIRVAPECYRCGRSLPDVVHIEVNSMPPGQRDAMTEEIERSRPVGVRYVVSGQPPTLQCVDCDDSDRRVRWVTRAMDLLFLAVGVLTLGLLMRWW